METRSNKPQDIKKAKKVEKLNEYFNQHEAVILADYRGISVAQDTQLRAKMRELGAVYVVEKNTLIKRAYDPIQEGLLDEYLEGPTAIAFSHEPVGLAKVFSGFIKETKKLSLKGGLLNNKLIDVAQIDRLAKLPAREVLLAQVAGALSSPLAGFAGVTAGLLRQLVTVTDQVREQKEQQA